MVANSKIEWCHHTLNPWWGCTKVSPGCANCYAEAFSKRTGRAEWGGEKARWFPTAAYLNQAFDWNAKAKAAGERHRVFCASMCDVFEEQEGERGELLDIERARLWTRIKATAHLDWLLLTKRPENVMRLLPAEWQTSLPRNVWVGASAEDQKRLEERWPILARIPAVVRFLSCEPLLEEVRLVCSICGRRVGEHSNLRADLRVLACPGHFPDWVIVGGESGHGAREFFLPWARGLVHDCKAALLTACFVKQLGAKAFGPAVPVPRRLKLMDGKGGDWNEWPEDLRIRQYPEVSHVL